MQDNSIQVRNEGSLREIQVGDYGWLDMASDRDIQELFQTDKAERKMGGVMYRYGGWNGFHFTTFETVDLAFSLDKAPIYEHLFTRYGMEFYTLKRVKREI